MTFNADGSVHSISVLCRIQGVSQHFFYLSSFMWILCLSINTYLQTFHMETHPKKFELIYLLLAWIIPALDTLLLSPLFLDYFQATDLWCWIGSGEHSSAQWLHFYFPLLAIIVVVLSLHIAIGRSLRARISGGRFGGGGSVSRSAAPSLSSVHRVPIVRGGVSTENLHQDASGTGEASSRFKGGISSMQYSWLLFLSLFILLRVPSLLHRGWEYLHPPPVGEPAVLTPQLTVLAVLHALSSPLQGLLVCILFVQNPRVRSVLRNRWRSATHTQRNVVSGIIVPSGAREIVLSHAESESSALPSEESNVRGYASLADSAPIHSPRNQNIQQVFPEEVWKELRQKKETQTIIPPTAFRTFPLETNQQPLPFLPASTPSASSSSSIPSSSASSSSVPHSFRLLACTWNLGNCAPALDLSHPSLSIFPAPSSRPPEAAHPSLNHWIPSGPEADQFDILCIGVQECEYSTSLRPRSTLAQTCCNWGFGERLPHPATHWRDTVLAVVNRGRDGLSAPLPGQRDERPFQTVVSINMSHIRLLVLLHPRLAPHLSDVHTSTEGAGLGNLYENKGGVGASFRLGPHSFAVVNTHLAALDGFENDRNEDVVQVLSRLQLEGNESASPSNNEDEITPAATSRASSRSLYRSPATHCTCSLESDTTLAAQVVLFLGDLNYRFRIPPALASEELRGVMEGSARGKKKRKAMQRATASQILRAIHSKDYALLRECDELTRLIKEKKLFVGWKEGELNFPPTYKYAAPEQKKNKGANKQKQLNGENHQSMSSTVREDGDISSPSSASSSSSSSSSSSPTPCYDAKRTPAWCDRILYRHSSSARISLSHYTHVPSVESSDHKPVRVNMDINFQTNTHANKEKITMGDTTTHVGNNTPTRKKNKKNNRGEEKEAAEADDSLSAVDVVSDSSLPSPTRRRPRSSDSDSSSSAAILASLPPDAQQFVHSHPGALDLISPASLKLLTPSPPNAASAAAAAALTPPPRRLYTIHFPYLAVYDVLDEVGLPLVSPYVSFVSSVLCPRSPLHHSSHRSSLSSSSSSHAGDYHCVRANSTISTPLPGSEQQLQALAKRVVHARRTIDPHNAAFSLFQSSATAMEAQAIKCAEWGVPSHAMHENEREKEDANENADGIHVQQGNEADIPLLTTAFHLTSAEMQSASLQLLLKDAHNVGENELLGTVNVELYAGMIDPHAEPVFFIAPILAQSRVMGFMSGTFKVQ